MHTGRPSPVQVVVAQQTAPAAAQEPPSGTHCAGASLLAEAAGLAFGRTSTVSIGAEGVAQPEAMAARVRAAGVIHRRNRRRH